MSYGLTTCTGTVWIILGYGIRWSLAGQVCAGDFVDLTDEAFLIG